MWLPAYSVRSRHRPRQGQRPPSDRSFNPSSGGPSFCSNAPAGADRTSDVGLPTGHRHYPCSPRHGPAPRIGKLVYVKDLVRLLRRIAVTVVGTVILAVGVVLLVAPGPGLLVIALALAVFAVEYEWARRRLAAVVARAPAPGPQAVRWPAGAARAHRRRDRPRHPLPAGRSRSRAGQPPATSPGSAATAAGPPTGRSCRSSQRPSAATASTSAP
jgi:hypothetical protein